MVKDNSGINTYRANTVLLLADSKPHISLDIKVYTLANLVTF